MPGKGEGMHTVCWHCDREVDAWIIQQETPIRNYPAGTPPLGDISYAQCHRCAGLTRTCETKAQYRTTYRRTINSDAYNTVSGWSSKRLRGQTCHCLALHRFRKCFRRHGKLMQKCKSAATTSQIELRIHDWTPTLALGCSVLHVDIVSNRRYLNLVNHDAYANRSDTAKWSDIKL